MRSVNMGLDYSESAEDLEQPPLPDLEAVGRRRKEEFDSLWEGCRVSVRAYLASMLANRSDVEDCVQEVAMIAWRKGPVAEGHRAFLGHCLSAARLIGLAASRKMGKSRIQFLPPDVAMSLADAVMQQEQDQGDPSPTVVALRACMAQLNERQRQWLKYRYEDSGRGKLEAAARAEGKTPDAIYKMLERLRATLRSCVFKRIEEDSHAR